MHDGRARRANRIGLAALLIMALGFVVVLGRVVQLQIAPGDQLAPFVGERTSHETYVAPRGDLLDRRGRVLAASVIGMRVFVDPYLLADHDVAQRDEGEVAERIGNAVTLLAAILGEDESAVADRIISRIAQNERRIAADERPIRYVSVGGVLSDAQLLRMQAVSIRGVQLEQRLVREAPACDAAAPIIGLVGVDHDGLLGAERRFDRRLQGQDGSIAFVRDARGKPLWVEQGRYEIGSRGADVRLSIDLALQEMAQAELARGVEDADAAGGRLVLADPNTGEVLVIVDVRRDVGGLSEFTPEAWQSAVAANRRVRFRTIRPDESPVGVPMRSRCVEDVYEPGSTFKSFMWSATLERGKVTIDEVFDVHKGRWRNAYGRLLADVTPKDELTWRDVLINSSNIGMTQGVDRLSFAEAHEAITRFGFGSKTDIGLPGESIGLVTSMKDWSKYTQTSVAMGYEVAVTPVQMVRAFSNFARTGDRAGTLPDLSLTAVPRESAALNLRRRVLPAEIAVLARNTMVYVAENMLRVMRQRWPEDEGLHGVRMFGKSGTAKIARPDGRGYFEQYNSSFVAGAPVEEPRLVILVVIDDPGPELIARRRHYGSQVAGPVAARVLKKALEYYGVPAGPADHADAHGPLVANAGAD
ncbi:MAG: penicillin-binding protein 2 [Phycisphaerales bacterium]|nr:penicillin-binding protein 2 [Phycisphaerales bacterium]